MVNNFVYTVLAPKSLVKLKPQGTLSTVQKYRFLCAVDLTKANRIAGLVLTMFGIHTIYMDRVWYLYMLKPFSFWSVS